MAFTGIGKLLKDFIVNTLTTTDKTIPGAINELAQDINELNGKTETDYITPEFYNSLQSWRTICTISGNTCCLQIGIRTINASSEAEVQICLIPEGYRPKFRILSPVYTSGTPVGYAYVDTDGIVTVNIGGTYNYVYMSLNYQI